MKKHMPVIVLIALFLVIFSIAALSIISGPIPEEISFPYYGGKIYNQISQYVAGWGMKTGDKITVYAQYTALDASGNAVNKKVPMLRIEMMGFHENKLAGAPWNYAINNDTWDFKVELLSSAGAVVKTFNAEIYEDSDAARAAGKTVIDTTLPNGEKAFHIELNIDSQGGAYQAEIAQFVVKAEQDVLTLVNKLGGDITAAVKPLTLTPSTFKKDVTKKLAFSFELSEREFTGYSIFIAKNKATKSDFGAEFEFFTTNPGWKDNLLLLSKVVKDVDAGTTTGEITVESELNVLNAKEDGKYLVLVMSHDKSKTYAGTLIEITKEGAVTTVCPCDKVLECLACIDKALASGVFK